MKLRKICLLISILSILGGVNSTHADLTCMLNQTSGTGSATGTLTIDTIGTVAPANITAWSIVVAANGNTASAMTNTSGSALDFGTKTPTMVSTASSLTITLATIDSPSAWGGSDKSRFCVRAENPGFCANSDPSYMLTAEKSGPTFGENIRFDGATGNQIWTIKTAPVSITLPCTCAVGGGVTSCSSGSPGSPVSAPSGLIFDKEPQIYSEEISIGVTH